MQKFLQTLFLILFLTIENSFGASSSTQNHQLSNTKTSLIASFYDDNGTKKLVSGFKINIEKGWKIYGNDDSGIGMPPQFQFADSKNYKNHNIFYPQALDGIEKIGNESIKYKYYENEIIFPIFIETLDPKQPTAINVKIDFALCKDVCVPVSQNFSLNIDDKIDEVAISEIEKFYGKEIIKKDVNKSDIKEDFNKIDLSFGDDIKNSKSHNKSLYLIIILAFIGGAILNIMPCVLPVISIKLMSIIKHSGATTAKIRFSFLSTIIGILSCFIFLAFLTFAIRKTGNLIGWGFQFQSPYFLIFLIIILIFFIAELLGIFTISFNQLITNIIDKKITSGEHKKNIFMPNFLSGILAVLLATPCSAPFLGSAISFAISQDFIIILTIFIFIGLGFATPYLILIIAPRLINLLPKSGNWMVKVKNLMAGFLIATNVWLLVVLSNIIGTVATILVAFLAIIIFALLKLKIKKIIKFTLLGLLIISSFTLPFEFYNHQQQKKQQQEAYWRVFDESILNNLIAENKIIIVDVTADWCLTCKLNKVLVLNSAEITMMLKNEEIIGLRADITKPDDAVMKFLAKHNRFAIPFNAVYGPNAKNGLLASELLNKKELLELINKAR